MSRVSRAVCVAVVLVLAGGAYGLERGTLLYHTSRDGELYGKDAALVLPCSVLDVAVRDLKSGHTAIYIGDLRIIEAVSGGIQETDSANFIPQEDLNEGFTYLGAKVPVDYDDAAVWPEERKDQIVLIAKEQVGKGYDLDLKVQTGPDSGDFTCVGLAEYVYEQAGYVITPMGFYREGEGGRSYTQVYNCSSTFFLDQEGVNTFSSEVRFSKISHPLDFCCGREFEDDKYIFFPYTQYLQASTVAVETDVPVSGGSGGDGGGCFIRTLR